MGYFWTKLDCKHAGYEGYLAGGMVRDLLLGRTPKDIDIVSSALPNQVSLLIESAQLFYPKTSQYGRPFCGTNCGSLRLLYKLLPRNTFRHPKYRRSRDNLERIRGSKT